MVNLQPVALILVVFFYTGTISAQEIEPGSSSEVVSQLKFGMQIWGENIILRAADGRSEKVDVKYAAADIGYRLGYKAGAFAYWLQADAFFLQGSAVSEGVSIDFSERVAGSFAGSGSGAVSFYPQKAVALDAGFGALYHQLQLSRPTSIVTAYEFGFSQPVKPYFLIGLNWNVSSRFRLEQSLLTFLDPAIDSAWNVSVSYMF